MYICSLPDAVLHLVTVIAGLQCHHLHSGLACELLAPFNLAHHHSISAARPGFRHQENHELCMTRVLSATFPLDLRHNLAGTDSFC